jgi:hypothetical protein
MRPVKEGMKVSLGLGKVLATGLEKSKGPVPMIKAVEEPAEGDKILSLGFEKNPLDSKASQKIELDLKQLEITYDAESIQKLINCFTWPSGVTLKK